MAATNGLPPAFPKGLRVLLVDDEEHLPCIESQLSQPELQYSVTCADSSTAALSYSRVNGLSSYDIVLAESRLVAADEITGKAFIDAFEDVPVVLMAEGSCVDDVMRAVRLGAVDFLDKPLSMLKLKNIWQHCVRKMMKKSAWYDSCSLRPSVSDPDMAARQGTYWGSDGHQQQSISTCMPSSMTAPIGYGGYSPHLTNGLAPVGYGASVSKNLDATGLQNRSSVDSPGTPSASDGDLADSISAISAARQSSEFQTVQQAGESMQYLKSEPANDGAVTSCKSDAVVSSEKKCKKYKKKSAPVPANTSSGTVAVSNAGANVTSRPPLACKPSSFGPLLPVPPSSQWPQLEPGCAWGTPVGGAVPPPPMQALPSIQQQQPAPRVSHMMQNGVVGHFTGGPPINSVISKPSSLLMKTSAVVKSQDPCSLIDGDINSGEFFKNTSKSVNGTGPIGLKLRKSDSLLDLINSALSEGQKA